MTVLAQGDSNAVDDVALVPGQGYVLTLTVPAQIAPQAAEWLAWAIRGAVGSVVNVQGVDFRDNGGWTDVVVTFAA